MWSGLVRAGAVAVALAALATARAARGDDDVAAGADPAARPPAVQPAIDLAAHVDINMLLEPNHWRVSGDLRPLVIAGRGRLVIGGNLTIGGAPLGERRERVRRTDAAILERLRHLQEERLADLAADRGLSAERRRALALATEVDIRRVTAEVVRLRNHYEGRLANIGDEAWQRFQVDVEACRRGLADPFGADSLFAAVRTEMEPADTGR